MKREFGREFVEQYLPGLDLQWVIDTSGTYIPGRLRVRGECLRFGWACVVAAVGLALATVRRFW
jgi:hypothetical protein